MNTQVNSINWKKVDLTDGYQRGLTMLDSYDFDTLLLEISCNIRDINEDSVKAQAMLIIKQKYQTAIEILNDNLTNITNQAKKKRNA
ncbi:MAG: hypothetical protein WCH21_12630 [Bacteroidota bacterium]